MPIEVIHLTHCYSEGSALRTIALNDVSFRIDDGEFVGIIGHTGSGKSTLVQHLNGLLKPSSGQVLINGEDRRTCESTGPSTTDRSGFPVP